MLLDRDALIPVLEPRFDRPFFRRDVCCARVL
jgi:hypothetical protein